MIHFLILQQPRVYVRKQEGLESNGSEKID